MGWQGLIRSEKTINAPLTGALAPPLREAVKPSLSTADFKLVLQVEAGKAVILPQEINLSGAEYSRLGPDLLLVQPDGGTILIRDYFVQEETPDLLSQAGAALSGDLIVKLAGPMAPGQYAQAAGKVAAQAIGRVETLSGAVKVTHADGTQGELHKGDSVFQGDILQTPKDASGYPRPHPHRPRHPRGSRRC